MQADSDCCVRDWNGIPAVAGYRGKPGPLLFRKGKRSKNINISQLLIHINNLYLDARLYFQTLLNSSALPFIY